MLRIEVVNNDQSKPNQFNFAYANFDEFLAWVKADAKCVVANYEDKTATAYIEFRGERGWQTGVMKVWQR
jgi:hypothetical protein